MLFFLVFPFSTSAFVLGLKSTDNTVENVVKIEKDYSLYLPLIGFIYDPRDKQDVVAELEKIAKELGNQRIYHISLSPNQLSAEEVAKGAFDEQYTLFFKTIKRLNLKVIFRTMHEMNGGWYPRGSNPTKFKEAWIHVWNLARSLGLNQQDILFDFSVNHRDMPTLWTPSQHAKLLHCKDKNPVLEEINKLKKKKKLTPEEQNSLKTKEKLLQTLNTCPHFEDYYPWEAYVDIVGVTFYNWGKATSNRLRKTPAQILNDPEWNTLTRLKALGKPLFIDEVGTTAVWYGGKYQANTSRAEFLSETWTARKNQRLKTLSLFLKENQFMGAVYFNVDYTNGLTLPLVGEADRAIINTTIGKFYDGFWDLYSSSKSDFSSLLALFGLVKVEVKGKETLLPRMVAKQIPIIEKLINDKFSDNPQGKSDLYSQLLKAPSGEDSFDQAIQVLSEHYVLQGSGTAE